jgi:hypothetical protein
MMSESRERRDELSSNRNFSISQRQRKEVSVEVLTSEIDHVKKMVDDLQLPSPAVDIGIGLFSGILVSGVFALISAYSGEVPGWSLNLSWMLTGIGLAGTVLCVLFRLKQKNTELEEKKSINDELERWKCSETSDGLSIRLDPELWSNVFQTIGRDFSTSIIGSKPDKKG